MPTINTTPRADLDAATERLVAASIAVAYIDSLPATERAGFVKARIRFRSAQRRYTEARAAYIASYPHKAATTPVLVAAR